jgi:predicted phosphodiesterase
MERAARAHHPGHEDEAKAKLPTAAPLPKGLILPATDGPAPWTDKPLFDDPDRFQIAIMTDNTGGHRPGVWMKAVEKVNLMRPTFVMSVGDLIEGYSTERAEVEAEWKEFTGFMDKMKMKFFFVAGNHDVTNPLMKEIWREHFGPVYYSFDYKGVHFVCLNTEDPTTKISDKQLEWLAGDLEKNKDARWTLLFMHKPLWNDAERAIAAGNPDGTNWKKVEQLLGDRPHTVFSGHVHYYAQYDRNGMKYYHLATTGGGSQLRGLHYGEFDHIAWLTMEKDGPHVANLLLDGIQPGDVVSEKSIGRFREFIAKTQLEVAPILVEDEAGFSQGRIDLRFTNRFDTPVEVSATIDGLPLRGLSVEPETLKLSAAPGKTETLSVTVKFADKIAFSHLAQTLMTASLRTTDKERPLTAERRLPMVIDRKHPLPKREAPLVVDGKFDDWPDGWLPMPNNPFVLGAVDDWKGPTDAGVAIQAAYDDKFLYLAARVDDEQLLAGDKVEWNLDSRPLVARSDDTRLREGTYRVSVTAPDADGASDVKVTGFGRARIFPGTQHKTVRRDGGYDVEVALPLEFITRNQPEWQSIQLTSIVDDIDEAGKKPASILWRGSNQAKERNTNFGHFVR